ncbi:MAG: hypothetical protein AB1716_08625 [Planctomycetota bacterium]
MSTEWSMPRRGEACAACRHIFEVGEVFHAWLFDAHAAAPAEAAAPGEHGGGFVRRDYCLRCSPPAEPAPLGMWRTRRPPAATRKTAPFDRAAIYALFERLDEAQAGSLPGDDAHDSTAPEFLPCTASDPAQEQDAIEKRVRLRFVLALLLWRKKVLRLERTLALADHEVWEFVTRTGAVHRVPRPQLDEAQLEQLSVQLEELLAGPDQADDTRATRTDRCGQPAGGAVTGGSSDGRAAGGTNA